MVRGLWGVCQVSRYQEVTAWLRALKKGKPGEDRKCGKQESCTARYEAIVTCSQAMEPVTRLAEALSGSGILAVTVRGEAG
jgi:hypothetical protein